VASILDALRDLVELSRAVSVMTASSRRLRVDVVSRRNDASIFTMSMLGWRGSSSDAYRCRSSSMATRIPSDRRSDRYDQARSSSLSSRLSVISMTSRDGSTPLAASQARAVSVKPRRSWVADTLTPTKTGLATPVLNRRASASAAERSLLIGQSGVVLGQPDQAGRVGANISSTVDASILDCSGRGGPGSVPRTRPGGR
jgi:hypothetical protein